MALRVPLLQAVQLGLAMAIPAESSLNYYCSPDLLLFQVFEDNRLELADEPLLGELEERDVFADLPPFEVSLDGHPGLFRYSDARKYLRCVGLSHQTCWRSPC